MFHPNAPFLYQLAALVVLFVLCQSAFFLWKAWRRAKAIGLSTSILRKTLLSTTVFTLAPAFAIFLGIVSLSRFLGLPLPWMRLSVIGAISYELPAASTAAQAVSVSLSDTIQDKEAFASIAWVMTLGIIPGPLLVPLLQKRLRTGLAQLKAKDEAWSTHFMDALFLGMISAFLGLVFAPLAEEGLAGIVPLLVLLTSALTVSLIGLLIKRFHWKGLTHYAIPVSMLVGMASALLYSRLF